jgi:cytochrome c oxidase subunit 2
VVEPAAFDAWLAGQAVETKPEGDMTPAEKGAALAESTGCLSCHTVNGSALVGPSWLGVFGSERQLDDGSTVVADEAYLRRSILEPEAQVVDGYPKVMPPAYDYLAAEDIDAIIEYIKSLGR